MANKRGGLIFGVIVGTLLGVLFAPKKGKELRKELKKEVEKGGIGTEALKQNFVEMGHDMAGAAEEIYLMPKVQQKVKEGKKKVGEIVHTAELEIGKAEGKIKDASEKYFDAGNEQVQNVTKKLESASKKVKGTLQNLRKKLSKDWSLKKDANTKSFAPQKPKKKANDADKNKKVEGDGKEE